MRSGIALAIAAAAIAAAGGYWAGTRGTGSAGPVASGDTVSAGDVATPARKIRFYRNPMGLPDTSPVPKKDPMGMDYIPVYEDEDADEPAAANQVRVSPEKIQKMGVRTELVRSARLDRVVRAAGRVEPDERRTYAIAPKFEGYVERLLVNATGQPVTRGQALFEVYSPELVSAQREYQIARQGARALAAAGEHAQGAMSGLADASLARLRHWDIPEDQLRELAQGASPRRTLTMRSPVTGVITEKKAVQGMRFMPGEMLYQVIDLSTVWVLADVFEQDLAWVKPGAKARVRINAYPEKAFAGVIAYVYPTLNAQTRTVPVRIELPNPGTLLKPGMYADLELPVTGRGDAVVVSSSAVIDSGVRRIVLVDRGEGRFEPREVTLGARGEADVEVIEGLRPGERVVVSANFLIDAESNLKAAVGSFSAPGQTPAGGAVPAQVGHRAEGKVQSVDVQDGSVTISHAPVASLKWPAMTMEFKVANTSLLSALTPGASVSFEFVERAPGEWVITAVHAAGARAGARAGR